MNTVAYAAINKDDAIREKSSSGAVFYELAKSVINNGGIVYGAKYDEDWSVIHGHTDTLDGLNDFLGSKYVQSSMADEYKNAEKNLKAGRTVLFSGTPCQIEGLKCFLGKEYEKLLTVDFICHGVPSPAVWKGYLYEVANGREVKSISFRDKTEGWLHFSLRMDFSEGSQHRQTQHEDLYMKGFLQNIYLRPSCYQCRFKTINRDSDITLADYWGVNRVLPDMFDDKGTSLIMIHSKRGKTLWSGVCKFFRSCEIDVGDVVALNTNAVKSVRKPEQRDSFYSTPVDKQFQKLKKLITLPFRKRVIRKTKYIAKKMIGRS